MKFKVIGRETLPGGIEVSIINMEGVTTRQELITPNLAKYYLSLTPKWQRNLHEPTCADYVTSMLAGNWHFHQQGIAFDTDGNLVDGRHRLTGIVRSGVSLPLMVTRGLGVEAMRKMDVPKVRTPSDGLKIGYDVDTNSKQATILRHIDLLTVDPQRKFDADRLYPIYCTYSEGLAYVVSALKSKHAGIKSTGVAGALVKAFYVCRANGTLDKLDRFIDILVKGVEVRDYKPDVEKQATRLREYLIASSEKKNGGRLPNKERYIRTVAYLQRFLSGSMEDIKTPTLEKIEREGFSL